MRRTVQWVLIGCAILALAAPAIAAQREFEIDENGGRGGHAVFLDRAGKNSCGPIELPQPPQVPLTTAQPGNSGKPGASVLPVSIGTRGGGMTRAERADAQIRTLIRKLG